MMGQNSAITFVKALDVDDVQLAVEELRSKYRIKNLTNLAREIGMDYTDLRNAMRGRSEVQSERFYKLARERWQLPEEWPTTFRTIVAEDEVAIKVLERAAAGNSTSGEIDPVEVYVPREMAGPLTVGVLAEGDSMMPHVRPGDIVVVEPADRPAVNRLMVVRHDGELIIKGVVFVGGRFMLRSFNPNYPDIEPSGSFVGNVTGIYSREGDLRRSIANPRGLRLDDFVI